MSRFTHRYPLNIRGKYYINDQCTDCDLCRQCAPDNIKRDDRIGISYVYKQPTTPEEIARIEEGVAGCPTEAVGNDGDRYDWDTTPIYDWNTLYAKQPDIRFDIRAPLLREDASRKTLMSPIQKLFVRILPRKWAEEMEADSRSWMMACSCGLARSLWELGGIRWKTAGRPLTFSFMKCPQCGKRSWQKVSRDSKEISEPPKT